MRSFYGLTVPWTVLLLFIAVLCPLGFVQAATLTFVSDTISTSQPSTTANHTIRFTTTNAIPLNGALSISPESGQFTIPAALGFGDMDLSINGVDTPLVATASGGTVGVSVVSGTSGSITLTFAQGLASQSALIVKIGTNAVSGGTGTHQITNSTNTGSYSIAIQSENSGVVIDNAKAMIAVIHPVDVGASQPTPLPAPPTPKPTPSNNNGGGGGGSVEGSPTGNVPIVAVPSLPQKACIRADINCDGYVNLVDFSIAAFWYKKPNPPTKVDMNGDSVVKLIDLSIMAYYWTG